MSAVGSFEGGTSETIALLSALRRQSGAPSQTALTPLSADEHAPGLTPHQEVQALTSVLLEAAGRLPWPEQVSVLEDIIERCDGRIRHILSGDAGADPEY